MHHPRLVAALCLTLSATSTAWAQTSTEPAPYCSGDYADDLTRLAARARELERQPYSFCVRNTAIYECLSYGTDGSMQRTRRTAVAHGTAFGYKQDNGTTLLMTNEHVAEWPAVTPDANAVDGVPAGCKRVSETLKVVDSEHDTYETDDIALSRVVVDPQLDAAILRAKATLPVLPWKIGRSAGLRERDVVEVRGFPLGAFAATNVGKVVSAFDHDDERDWDHDDFVIDALLSAGNSGSPVLAVSCKTGEFELVGMFHAGYTQGSALNVVIGIDQLRDLMTTLKRTPRNHGEALVVLDAATRAGLQQKLMGAPLPFFPYGPLAASVRSRNDGALVFEVYTRDFPFHTTPLFAFEDLAQPGSFGEVGRSWFGGAAGLKRYTRADLDADAQANLARVVDGLRRDAVSFLAQRSPPARTAASRQEFERTRRAERTLSRVVQSRHDAASALSELADRLAPHAPEPPVPTAELMLPLPPTSLAAVAKPAPPPSAAPIAK